MPILTNTEINAQQMAECLAVVNNAGHLLGVLESDDKKTEAQIAVEVTLMAACDRLDTILKDESRWKLPEKDGHNQYDAIATEQANQMFLGNELKKQEVFAAEFNKQMALARITGLAVKSEKTGIIVPAPAETPQPTKKNAKRKK